MNLNRKIIFYLIMVTIVLLPTEVLFYYLGKKVFLPRGLVFVKQTISEEDYVRYMNKRHPDLGWICDQGHCDELDEEGSRLIPAFPDPIKSQSCVSAYGCSYTFSNRNTAEDSWCNKLSLLLECRVSNFGVSGYGNDQAYLRYALNPNDSAQVVILNHFVFDIERNVNQHWGTRFSGAPYGLKPRYITKTNGDLQLIRLPDFSYDEYKRLLTNPSELLKHEFYRPNGPFGVPELKFPFTFSIFNSVLFHGKFRSYFSGQPVHMQFYQDDHASGALEVTLALMKQFVDTCRSRGQIPLIHVIPHSSDFEYFEKHGEWPYQNLVNGLDNLGIGYIDSGDEISTRMESNKVGALYAGEGHMNAKGDSLLAQVLYEKIGDILN